MKTYDINYHDGRLFAFEVNNTLLGRRAACEIARSIPGAHVVRQPQFLSWWREDVFCEFLLGAFKFEIWEPFGDNSRYWIGPAGNDPADMRPTEELALIREAFARAGAKAWFSARAG
jgi:hypothetical protein